MIAVPANGTPARAERSRVRQAGRTARRSIQGSERVLREAALIAHLLSLDAITGADQVGVFVAHDGEPDLNPVVDLLWNSGIGVALPVLRDDPDDYTMRFVPWCRNDQLQPGRYDIPVPPRTSSTEPDVLLVSFTGFDATGSRIGRGAGFFDRYLAGSRSHTIGVGFEAQRFDQVPTENHDVPMPVIVTDLGVRFLQ